MYTKRYELLVLKLFMDKPDLLKKYSSMIEPSHFSTPELSMVYSTIRDLAISTKFDKITPDILLTEILSKNNSVDQSIMSKIIALIYSQSVDDDNWVIDKLKSFVKVQALKKALSKSIDIIEKGEDLHRIITEIDNAISTGIDDSYIDANFMINNFIDKYRSRYDNIIKTGYSVIDDSMFGGLLPGELHAIMAPPKIGKSTFAANIGYRVARLNNKAVIHITLELSELDISSMYVQIAGKLSHGDILSMSNDEYKHRIELILNTLKDKIFIKWFVPGSNIMHIRSFVSKLRSEGLIDNIGLIIIDYDDLLSPSDGNKSMYEDPGSIYKEMIRLANTFKTPVLTLAQPNREAWLRSLNSKNDNIKLLESFDISHSIMKTFYTTSLFSLNRIPDSNYYVLHPCLIRRGRAVQDGYLKGNLNVRTFTEASPVDSHIYGGKRCS